MPSISGPRSTAASGTIVTPFIAGGAGCWPRALHETAIKAAPTNNPAKLNARRRLMASSFASRPPNHSEKAQPFRLTRSLAPTFEGSIALPPREQESSVALLAPSGPAEVPDEPVDPGAVEEALPAARECGRVDVAGADGAQREVHSDHPGDVAQPKIDAQGGKRAGAV